MHLIKNCPSCGKKLRFPINHGKIKIKCSCGYQFVADPDNPELYKNGKIDASPGKKLEKTKKFFNFTKLKNISLDNTFQKLYDLYYQILNLRVLTGKERTKILIKLFILLIILTFIISMIILLTLPGPKKVLI